MYFSYSRILKYTENRIIRGTGARKFQFSYKMEKKRNLKTGSFFLLMMMKQLFSKVFF